MRLFLTLCSLAVVVYAKPQYNYGTGISGGSSTGFLGAPTSFGGSSFSAPSFGGSSFNKYQGAPGGFSSGSLSGFGNGLFGAASQGSSFQNAASQGANFQQSGGFEAPTVHKQFFTIAAPEDNDNLERTKHFVIGRPQKNYRVVFIKAPSSSNTNLKLSAEYAPQEEKTAIYVLSKKDATLEVNDIATPAPTVPSKPEIFFIKYKTEEEAQHAQRTIQAEYDKIEGTSEHTDGGIGKVQSVIGSLDGGAGAASSSSGTSGGPGSIGFGNGAGVSSGANSPTYLPPGK